MTFTMIVWPRNIRITSMLLTRVARGLMRVVLHKQEHHLLIAHLLQGLSSGLHRRSLSLTGTNLSRDPRGHSKFLLHKGRQDNICCWHQATACVWPMLKLWPEWAFLKELSPSQETTASSCAPHLFGRNSCRRACDSGYVSYQSDSYSCLIWFWIISFFYESSICTEVWTKDNWTGSWVSG